MPLIIPKIDGSSEQEWLVKLMGKTLTDGDHSETAFSKRDLPEGTTVVKGNASTAQASKAGGLVVHVDDDGIIKSVQLPKE